MKNKLKMFFMIILVCCLTGCHKESDNYRKFQYPNEDFFGKEVYSEIDYKANEEELEIGQTVVDQATKVFNYLGAEEEADQTVGALTRYYYFSYHPDTKTVDANVELITCKKVDGQYHVWAVYTVERYDEHNQVTNGSAGILTLWTCQVDDNGNVKVIDVKEAP